MGFGLLMHDNTPVDARYRGVKNWGPGYGNLNVPGMPFGTLRAVPGMPYGRFRSRRFGALDPCEVPGTPDAFGDENATWVFDEDGNLVSGGDTTTPTNTTSSQTTANQIGTAAGQLATSFVNAFTSGGGPATAGSCPSGYYRSGASCVRVPSSGMSMTPLLIGGGLLAAYLLMRRRGSGA